MKKLQYFCATGALALASFCFQTVLASTITGTAYEDTNTNGVYDLGEELAGITVELYEDNGDGSFDTSDTLVLTETTTGSNGVYTFSNLDSDKGYFLVRPGQVLGNVSYTSSVGSLLKPSAPLNKWSQSWKS